MNGPWSSTATAWVGYNAAWQPIELTAPVSSVSIIATARPATAIPTVVADVGCARCSGAVPGAAAQVEAIAELGTGHLAVTVNPVTVFTEQIVSVQVASAVMGLSAHPAAVVAECQAAAGHPSLSAIFPSASAMAMVEAQAGTIGLICRPLPATSLVESIALVEAVALSIMANPCTAGTGIRETFRFDSTIQTQSKFASTITTSFRFNSFIEVEKS